MSRVQTVVSPGRDRVLQSDGVFTLAGQEAIELREHPSIM